MARPVWAQAFLDQLGDGPGHLLQVHIARVGSRYRLCHVDEADATTLVPATDLASLARTTADGRYRNLPYAPDLRRGWVLDGLDADELLAALETLYPAALAVLHAERVGTLPIVDWPALAKRQTGWQGLVKRVDEADASAAVAAFCHDGCCLRRLLWRVREDGAAPGGAGQLPCGEPCSLFLGFVQKIARLRRDEPSGGGDDPRWRRWLALTSATDTLGDQDSDEE